MAKTIKFNLICDEKPVRTIEDLQNNFSIEDVLAYYNNKLLHRWLSVRGYDSELESVSAITSNDPMEIIKELIRIFEVVTDEKKVGESIYMMKYLDERKGLCSIYEQENYKAKNIIEDYETGYRQLVDGILENPNDIAIIKANIAEIVSNYSWILELNHRELFWVLRDKSVLAIMCLLMNSKSRNYYLPVECISEDGEVKVDIENDGNNDKKEERYKEIRRLSKDSDFKTNDKKGLFGIGISHLLLNDKDGEVKVYIEDDGNNDEEEMYEDIDWLVKKYSDFKTNDKKEMYEEICRLIKDSDFKTNLNENLIVFAGMTDGYWKDLEPKGKRFMIVSMGKGDYVRSAGVSGEDLSSSDILNKFVIVDGIDYKSNSNTRELLYMEV